MSDYKRRTSPIYFRGRTVHDPSKQMYDVANKKKTSDAKHMREYDTASAQYGTALKLWKENLDAKDKETVDFLSTMSNTIKEGLGTTLPKALGVHAERADAKIVGEFESLPPEKQNAIRTQLDKILLEKEKKENQRKNLETLAEELGLTEIASHFKKYRSDNDHRLYLHLIQSKLNGLANTIQSNLASSDKIYTYTEYVPDPNDKDGNKLTAVTRKFSGQDVYKDSKLFPHFLTQSRANFIKSVQVGGINTNYILAESKSQLDNTFAQIQRSEGIKIMTASAKFKVHELTGSVPLELKRLTEENIDGGYNIREGSKANVQQILQTTLNDLRSAKIQDSTITNVQGSTYDSLAKILHGLYIDLGGDEPAEQLINEMLGNTSDKDNPNIIYFEHTDGSGTKVTLGGSGGLDTTRFGTEGKTGSWKTIGDQTDSPNAGSKEGIGVSLDKTNWSASPGLLNATNPNAYENQNPFEDWEKFSATHGLNPEYRDTWKYKILFAMRSGQSVEEVEAIRQAAITDLRDNHKVTPKDLAIVRELTDKRGGKTLTKDLIKELTLGNEIRRKDLNNYNIDNDVLSNLREMNINLVDEFTASEVMGSAEGMIFNKLNEIGKPGFNAGKEAIADSILEQALIYVQGLDLKPDQQGKQLITEVERILSEDFAAAQNNTGHKWFINKDGNAPNQYNAWSRFWGVGDFKEDTNDALIKRNQQLVKTDSTEGLFSSTDILNQMNYIKENKTFTPDFILTASLANKNPIELFKEQVKENGMGLEGIDQILADNKELQALLSTFEPKDIANLFKHIGNKSSNDFNISASRELNKLVSSAMKNRYRWWRQGEFFTGSPIEVPNENALLKTLSMSTVSDINNYKTKENGITYVGKYNLPENLVEQSYNRLFPGQSYTKDKVLGDAKIQNKIARDIISNESGHYFDSAVQFVGGKPLFAQTKTGGYPLNVNVARAILHTLSTGQRVELRELLLGDFVDRTSVVYLENTRMLMHFLNHTTGGFVPNRNDLNFYPKK